MFDRNALIQDTAKRGGVLAAVATVAAAYPAICTIAAISFGAFVGYKIGKTLYKSQPKKGTSNGTNRYSNSKR